MSVAIICCLSEGVVIGVDSAVTLSGRTGINKIFEGADKLFALGRAGLATYGVASLSNRTIGSLVHEFKEGLLTEQSTQLKEIAEAIRAFFFSQYSGNYERVFGQPIADIPLSDLPTLGLLVGGFSLGANLPELFQIELPAMSAPYSAKAVAESGKSGLYCYACSSPIERYLNGVDDSIVSPLLTWGEGVAGRPLSQEERNGLYDTLLQPMYRPHYWGMPLKVGIEWVRALLQLEIAHYRFVEGAPVVGGTPQIGFVSYNASEFSLIG